MNFQKQCYTYVFINELALAYDRVYFYTQFRGFSFI